MPTLNITTNVPGDALQHSDVLKALSSAVADSVGKPEQWVMVSLTTGTPMIFGATEAPCAFGELISIGSIGGTKNAAISAAISGVLQAKLNMEPARFYLKFTDVTVRSDFGWNGKTF